MRRLITLLAIAVAGCATAPSDGYVEVIEGTTRVTCRGADLQAPFGSRLARGPRLTAPGGERSAWVEVEARALRDGGGEGTCQNISRLFIEEGGAARVAFTQRPGWEGRNGNAIDLVDWSPDGRRLLFELHTWTYPTDPVDPLLVVWNADTRAAEPLAIQDTVRDAFGEDCAWTVRARGFDEQGWAIVEVLPLDDSAQPSCVSSGRILRAGAGGARIDRP